MKIALTGLFLEKIFMTLNEKFNYMKCIIKGY
ncbi:hypothetical protein N018_14710 [Pseudomonas syringae CC1557]|uniref:Uncharacterized protein n=1 Tax=Pseudomonas syringae CC1557 TaxID=1357279 RepID=W0MSG2_PSESX|nr:hypothetical protein N018_14710 [Pseudomonas syringae CC1557]